MKIMPRPVKWLHMHSKIKPKDEVMSILEQADKAYNKRLSSRGEQIEEAPNFFKDILILMGVLPIQMPSKTRELASTYSKYKRYY